MTVEELIEILLTLDPKAKIECLDDDPGEIDIWTNDERNDPIMTIELPLIK